MAFDKRMRSTHGRHAHARKVTIRKTRLHFTVEDAISNFLDFNIQYSPLLNTPLIEYSNILNTEVVHALGSLPKIIKI